VKVVTFGLAAVLAPWAILYWIFSYEPAGTAALVLTTVGFLFVGVYLAVKARQGDEVDAAPEEGVEVDLGFFPTASPWPATIALAATVIAYGLVFSVWIALPGVALLVFALAAMAVESHRSTTATGDG